MNAAVGVLIGLVASAISGLAAFWWKSRRDLQTAARQCFDRLIKLQQAQNRQDPETEEEDLEREKVINNETNSLGGHMDLYLASLGAVVLPDSRRRHWDAYESMVPILINKDLAHLDVAIKQLRRLVKASDLSATASSSSGKPRSAGPG